MAVYESVQYDFSIQYPAEWREDPSDPGLYKSGSAGFAVVETDLIAAGLGATPLAEYVDFSLATLALELPDFTVVSREKKLNPEDLPVEIVHTSAFAGLLIQGFLFYMHDSRIAFLAFYTAPKASFEELRDMSDYSFSTFRDRSFSALPP